MNPRTVSSTHSRTPSPGGWWSPTHPSTGPRRTATSSPACSRKPLGAQEDAIKGAALSLEAHRGTTVVGEMGTGKTFIAAAAAHLAGFKRVLVLCPPHLVPKWKREVEMTVPGARAVIVKSITDLERLRLSVGSGPLFAVMSREKAKLSYRWMPAVIEWWATSKGRLLRDEETGEPFRAPCCPDCTAQIVDKDGVPLTDEDLEPPQAHLRQLRLSPLAGRQVRPRPLPSGRLREAPHEGLLRPAGRRRGARVQGARKAPRASPPAS